MAPATHQSISAGYRQTSAMIAEPAAQTATASTVVVADSELDARAYRSVSYTIRVATFSVLWSVWGANAADFSDEVAVLAAVSVAAGAGSSYAVAQAPYAYYRVKIIDDAGHGVATVRGIAKP